MINNKCCWQINKIIKIKWKTPQ